MKVVSVKSLKIFLERSPQLSRVYPGKFDQMIEIIVILNFRLQLLYKLNVTLGYFIKKNVHGTAT